MPHPPRIRPVDVREYIAGDGIDLPIVPTTHTHDARSDWDPMAVRTMLDAVSEIMNLMSEKEDRPP